MKVFHASKYEYRGVFESPVDGRFYYGFVSKLKDFTPEIVLVREARLVDIDGANYFFNEKFLDNDEMYGT